MSYGAALPAGAYAGALGAYRHRRQAPSNQGAAMRHAVRSRAVSLGGCAAGLGGLGEGENLCTDPGWAVARTLIGGTADMLSGAFAPSTTTDKMGKTTTSGGGTEYYAASGAGVVVGAWDAACAAEAQQQNMDASYANTLQLQQEMERQRLYNEQVIASQRAGMDAQLAQMLMMQGQQQRPAAAPGGIDQNTLLIGGGILAALAVAALVLK